MYLGDFVAGSTVRFTWDTLLNGTGSITRATNGSIRIYKDGSDVQRSSANGITDTEDFDSLTGHHFCAIDLSDNTDAGFYAAGSDYRVVIQGMVISGMTINATLAHFSIENRNDKADVREFGGSAGTFSGGRPEVNTTHAAGTAWGSGAITAASIATGAIDADAIADNAIDAGAIATGALTAAKFAAGAIDAAALAADAGTEIATAVWASGTRVLTANTNLNDPTAAAIADAVWDEDATGHQTGGTFGQAIGDPGADTTTIYQSVVTDAAGTNVAADIIAIKAQTAAIETDTAEIGAAGAGLTVLATAANLATVAGYLDTEIAAILADTNELQTDLVDGGRLDLLIDAIKAKTDNLPSDPADASVIAGRFDTLDTAVADLPTNAELATSQAAADDATLAAIAALNNLSAAQVNAEVDAAIETYHLDHLLAVAYDPASKPGAADALLNELVESDAGVARFTANALEQAPTGGSAPSAADIRAEIDSNSTQLAAIKAKTDGLPASPAATGDAMTLTAAYDFAKGTVAMTEAYAANGVAPTPVQAMFAIHQMLMQHAISGTTWSAYKLDNVTVAFAVTLNDATTPTSARRV